MQAQLCDNTIEMAISCPNKNTTCCANAQIWFQRFPLSDTAAGHRGGGGGTSGLNFFQSNSIRNTSGMAIMVVISVLMVVLMKASII